MKIFKLFLAVPIFLFVSLGFQGCSEIPLEKRIFPETVGNFKHSNVLKKEKIKYLNEKNKGQTYNSWYATYVLGGTQGIHYIAGVHKTNADAENEQDLSMVFPDDDRNTQLDDSFFISEPLNNKAGQPVGTIKIYREAAQKRNTLGGYIYRIALSVNNFTYSLKPSSNELNNALVEFVKSLPLNADVDFSILDKEIAGRPNDEATWEELFNTAPPVKLAPKPYINGKVMIVERKPFNNKSGATFFSDETDYYIGDSSRHAKSRSEIGTLIILDCAKGNRIGEYLVYQTGAKVPIYSSVCKVSVIDNSIPAIIAQKTFVNSEVDKEKRVTGAVSEDFEYIAPDSNKISDFIYNLEIR
jgi:hypothetical protein